MSEAVTPRFPTALQEPEPVPDFPYASMGMHAKERLAGLGYSVWAGFDIEDLPQILDVAAQPTVRNYAWEDATPVRFGTPEAAAAWVRQGEERIEVYGRAMFMLINRLSFTDGERLAGYGWIEPKLPDAPDDADPAFQDRISRDLNGRWAHVAIRMSEKYAAKDRAVVVDFTKLMVAAGAYMCGARRFWTQTWQSNPIGPPMLDKAGWDQKFLKVPGRRRQGNDGGLVDDVRMYYTYPDENLVFAS